MNEEQVLPKASLEYESFCVINELNNLKVRRKVASRSKTENVRGTVWKRKESF